MEDFVIASNNENRVEAFYIQEGTVMHTAQINPGNKLKWSAPAPLIGGNSHGPLNNATRVEACTDAQGMIQVVAVTGNGAYVTCIQTQGGWEGWSQIEQ